MENMMAYHEAVVFKIVLIENERRSADTEQSAELIVVQFSVTERLLGRPRYGGVAQLGEHLPCKQGVMGSIPIISTSQQ